MILKKEARISELVGRVEELKLDKARSERRIECLLADAETLLS